MPNSWSFNWVSMVTREGEGLEARFVESLLVFYVLCVFLYIIRMLLHVIQYIQIMSTLGSCRKTKSPPIIFVQCSPSSASYANR